MFHELYAFLYPIDCYEDDNINEIHTQIMSAKGGGVMKKGPSLWVGGRQKRTSFVDAPYTVNRGLKSIFCI